jgi:hypothetical protein
MDIADPAATEARGGWHGRRHHEIGRRYGVSGIAAGIQGFSPDQGGARLVGHNAAIKIVYRVELSGILGATPRAGGNRQSRAHEASRQAQKAHWKRSSFFFARSAGGRDCLARWAPADMMTYGH